MMVRIDGYEIIVSQNDTRLKLTSDESEQIRSRQLQAGQIKVYGKAVYLFTKDNDWLQVSKDETLVKKLEALSAISDTVNIIRDRMRKGEEYGYTSALQDFVKVKLKSYFEEYKNYPNEDKDISRFIREHPAISGIYETLITPDVEILNLKNVYDNNVKIVDGHNSAIQTLLQLQEKMIEASEENIKKYFPESAKKLIADMWGNPDIFLTTADVYHTSDMTFVLREDFIAGDAWNKIDTLRSEAEETEDAKVHDKLLYGVSELEKAVGWTPIEEAEFSPHSSWIPQDIIRSWVTDEDGLNHTSSYYCKNDEGKWGIDDMRGAEGGKWIEEANPVIYYLNRQKQRSKNIDTDSFNKEKDELFKSYIANHETYRNQQEPSVQPHFQNTSKRTCKNLSR